MIKIALTMLVTAIAGIVAYLLSDTHRERTEQRQRDRIAQEVSEGDEAAVNARLGRFRAVWPWLIVGILVAAGCVATKTVYVREKDQAGALRPGQVYTNSSDSVEWIVPRGIMTKLIIANEKL